VGYEHSRKEGSSHKQTPGLIDMLRARETTRKFLQQLHSTVIFKDAVLKKNVWEVTMDVGLIEEQLLHVKVDAYTGRILECV